MGSSSGPPSTPKIESKGSDVAASFDALLARLAEAHERELAEGLSRLQAENEALRALAGSSAEVALELPQKPLLPPPMSEPPHWREVAWGLPQKQQPPPLPKDEALHFRRVSSRNSSKVTAKIKSTAEIHTLKVHIHGATGLRQTDWTLLGLCDPNAYCVCEVLTKPEVHHQTQVVAKSADPHWNSDFSVPGFRPEDALKFTVYSKTEEVMQSGKETDRSDKLLGQVVMQGKTMFEDRLQDAELALEEAGDGASAKLRISFEVKQSGSSSFPPRELMAEEDWEPTRQDSFDPRPIWSTLGSPRSTQLSPLAMRATRSNADSKQGDLLATPRKEERVVNYSNWAIRLAEQHFISPPGSRVRLVWDVIGALLIVYDSLVIPLQVFNLPPSDFLLGMDAFTMLFWTLNMGMSMTMGYFRDGEVEMRFPMICKQYFKTWFLVDCVVVLPDWYFNMQAFNAEEERSGQALKMLRIVRLFRSMRLVRLLKLRWILEALNDLVNSETAGIAANIVKMILMLLFINHFIACIWFLIGDVQTGTHVDTWISAHGFEASSWQYKYLTCLHWSITQFTPASMHVQPHNILERTFAITVVVFALVGFSYLVGSITTSLSQLRSMSEEHSKQFWTLRRYMKQQQVDMTLRVRIKSYLEHAWQRQKTCVPEPKLLGLLSEQLWNELQGALSVPTLKVHPLFEHLNEVSDVTVQRLAVKAISRRMLAQADRLFFPGETATHVHFVVEGRLRYHKAVGVSKSCPDGGEVVEWVEKQEDWISEPVLWTPCWVHLGTLQAHTEAALLLVDGAKFGEIVSLTPSVFATVRNYAMHFLEWMNGVAREDLSDISQGEDVSGKLQSFLMEDALPPRRDSDEYIAAPKTAGRNSARTAWGPRRSSFDSVARIFPALARSSSAG